MGLESLVNRQVRRLAVTQAVLHLDAINANLNAVQVLETVKLNAAHLQVVVHLNPQHVKPNVLPLIEVVQLNQAIVNLNAQALMVARQAVHLDPIAVNQKIEDI